MMNQSLGTQVT